MDNLTRDTANSYLWNQIAVTLDGITLTLGGVVVGRTLGLSALGSFGWVMSAVGLTTLVAGLGLKETVAVLVQRHHGDAASQAGLFRLGLYVRVAAAAAAATALAGALWKVKGVETAVVVSVAFYAVALLLSGYLSSFDIALFQTRFVAAGKTVSSLLTLAVVAFGALEGSLSLVFAGFAAGTFVGTVFFFLPLRRLAFFPAPSYPAGPLFDLSLTLWLVAVFNYLLGAQAVPLVLKVAGAGAGQIGAFTAAFVVATAANGVFMGGFANVALAAFSRADSTGGRQSLGQMHSLYVRVTAAAGVPLLLGAILYAPFLVLIPLKGGDPRAVSALIVLSAAFLVGRLLGGGAHSTALYAAGLHRRDLVVRAAFAVISVCAAYVAAKSHGMVAAAAAAGLCSVGTVLVEYVLLRTAGVVSMPWPELIRVALNCGVVMLVAQVILARGGLFAGVFSAIVFVAGSVVALAVARPLRRGEASAIAPPGMPSKVMALFEARDENDD